MALFHRRKARDFGNVSVFHTPPAGLKHGPA